MRPADAEQEFVSYHAEPGSTSAESLRLLASWAASEAVRPDSPSPVER